MSDEIQLIIKMSPSGIQVAGPIHDKILCYGLLEAARDAIREYKVDPKRIIPIRGNIPNPVTR